MKKGIICAVLALMVVFSMAGFAVAEENTTVPSQDVTVNYATEASYIWQIPTPLAVGATGQNISISELTLDSTKSLQISVASGNAWKLKLTSPMDEVSYKITVDGVDYSANGPVLTVPAGTSATTDTPYTASIAAAATTQPKYVGTYSDTLTFTASVIPTPSQ